MTGLELALAIIPLVIAAAEHQTRVIEDGKLLASNRVRDDRQLDFYYELFDELSLLASTLGGLFAGLPARSTTESVFTLTHDEQQALNDLLGPRAVSFQSILERLLKSLEDVISDKSVTIDKDDISITSPLPFFAKLESFRAAMRGGGTMSTLISRFRFTRNEKSRRVAMKKIKENNEKLERLLRGSESSYTFKSTVTKPRTARLRRLSEPLYTKIAENWFGSCQCHGVHEARLYLWNCCSQHRLSRSMDSVDLMLSVSDIGEGGTPWQESLILIPPESEKPQTDTKVRFAPLSSTTHHHLPRRDVDTESFCDLIQSASQRRMTLQILFEGGKLWQTQTRRQSLSINRRQDVTLVDLLSDSAQTFSLREQRILAVILAHAALHGANGSWLDENWSKEHIAFFRLDDSSGPDIRHPFLKLRFDAEAIGIDEMLFCMHPNPRVLALGILLLEIYLESTIESKWSASDLINGQANENTNLTTALRLLEDSEGKLYEGYRAAIRACLEFDLAQSDGEDLRQRIYEDIVLPLELELEHGFHITPEDLELTL